MKRLRNIYVALLVVVLVAVVAVLVARRSGTSEDIVEDKVVVVSPHPIEFMKPLINEFESETGIMVEVIQCGTSEGISRIQNGEKIDVLWGGSILSVGSYEDLFLPYSTENEKNFYDEYKNVGRSMNCFTDVPSVLMVNTDLLGDMTIEGYEDLLKPELFGKIAFASPEKSSSSFEHLTNMLYAMGGGDPEKGWDFAEKFAAQLGGKLLESSSLVYQGVASGKFVVGLTFEEAAITMLKSGKHVKVVYMKEGVVSTPDGLYINKNATNADGAKAFVDFMTSRDTQFYITSDLGRRSVRSDVESSMQVADKEDLTIIQVEKEKVIESKSVWVSKFMSYVREDRDE
ncbi:MAG: extracellular solute-binding protein [Butyrivibrio sp.]|nr:extracellular solute-binding protein [Butyrivibrio sp.]